MIGLLAGDAPVMFLPAINAGPHIASGKLRALAVTSRERLAAFPDLPTIAESGLPGYESSQWYGLLAPAGTPREIDDFLTAQVVRIMHAPEMQARMTRDGLVAIGSTRDEFAAHIKSELDKWARVIRAAGATVD
jgi:tripartite-type tricarboxylate transporter receptor subunit TctC